MCLKSIITIRKKGDCIFKGEQNEKNILKAHSVAICYNCNYTINLRKL